jgi:hypothetical protein
VREDTLGYLMSAESNGVNRVIHVQYPKNMENKNKAHLATHYSSVKGAGTQ